MERETASTKAGKIGHSEHSGAGEHSHHERHLHEMNLVSSCLGAALMLKEYKDSQPENMSSGIIFRENVLVPDNDLRVPHSELAMHTGAADGWIMAWVLGCRSAGIVYKTHGKCHFISGIDTEVMKPDLVKYTRRMHMKHVKCKEPEKI